MVKACDIVEPTTVQYLSEWLARISSDNQTSNIANLELRGVPRNTSIPWDQTLQAYRSQLSDSIMDASPGSEMIKCKVERTLWLLVPVILLVLGSIGNCASFAILSRKRNPSYVYLSALAMADQGVLLTGLMRHSIDRVLGFRMEDTHHWACVLTQLIGSSLSYLSAWLIVAVTAERAFVIMLPLSSVGLYSRNRETVIVIAISVTCLLAASHFLLSAHLETGQEKRFTLNIDPMKNFSECQLRAEFHTFSKAWFWIDGILYSYLPFFLILCLNGLIVFYVKKSKSRRHLLTSAGSPSNHTQIRDSSARCYKYSNSNNSASRQTVQLTLMLMSISICFLITTCPIVVMKIVSLTLDRSNMRVSTLAFYQFLDTVAELLMYLNHSANFYLYCATGSRFRSELSTLCSVSQITITKSKSHPHTVRDLSIRNQFI